MKVERKEAEFQPVVITLETQDEVNALWDLMGQIPQSAAVDGEDYLRGLYAMLRQHVDEDSEYQYYDFK